MGEVLARFSATRQRGAPPLDRRKKTIRVQRGGAGLATLLFVARLGYSLERSMPRLLILVLSLALLPALRAAAQPEVQRARNAFEQGRAAYEAGNYRAALERFQEAYELTHEADVLYNVATAADRLREDRIALDAYRGYLEARPNTPDRAQITARIAVLTERIQEAEEESARLEQERRQREEERRALREELARRPTTTTTSSDPGPVPWILTASGAALLVAGAALLIAAEVDAACVRAPANCVASPTEPMWAEVSERYERIPIFNAVGGVLLGVGAVSAAIGLGWGLSAGASSSAVEVSIGPSGVLVRGRM